MRIFLMIANACSLCNEFKRRAGAADACRDECEYFCDDCETRAAMNANIFAMIANSIGGFKFGRNS